VQTKFLHDALITSSQTTETVTSSNQVISPRSKHLLHSADALMYRQPKYVCLKHKTFYLT